MRGLCRSIYLEDVWLGTGNRAERLPDEVRNLVQDVDLTHDARGTRQQDHGRGISLLCTTHLLDQSSLALVDTRLNLQARLDLLLWLSDLLADPLEPQPRRPLITRLGILGRARMRRPADIPRLYRSGLGSSVDRCGFIRSRLATYDQGLSELGRIDATDVGFDSTGFRSFGTVIVGRLEFHLNGSD